MHEVQGVLGVAGFSSFFVNRGRGHAHHAHFERGLSGDVNTVALLACNGVHSRDGHLMVLVVRDAEHGGHGDGEIPEVAVRPDRGALCVGGVCVGKLVGRERGGVHDVALGVVGVGCDVPTR